MADSAVAVTAGDTSSLSMSDFVVGGAQAILWELSR
jgi:hypothetical protein